MTDREKTAAIFDCILNHPEKSCRDAVCPYDNECYGGSMYVVMPKEACENALALLRKQDAVDPSGTGSERETEETKLMNIIVKIPEDTARLVITADIIGEGGKAHRAESVLSASDIHRARNDFVDNVDAGDDYDAVYALTAKSREMAERMKAEEQIEWGNLFDGD